jgi:hypothetical protein
MKGGHMKGRVLAYVVLGFSGLAACDRTGVTTGAEAPAEAAYAELQARGQQAMGVDQYTSTHRFDALADGGRIELQRDVDDADGVAHIRQHLQASARAFAAGDFSTPAFVHLQAVPGGSVMAAKRDAIHYTYRELPRGGELRLVTQDPQARAAIHEFMTFQRQEHRAGGARHPHGPAHTGHEHSRRHDTSAGGS